MSEANVADAPQDEPVVDPDDKTATSDNAQSDEESPEDLERDARRDGWKPKDQWKGDPNGWVDAATFVKRGREFLPIVNAKLSKELEASNAKLHKLEKTLERFAEHHSKTEQRAYERAMKDLETRQDAAAEAGDVQAVRDITREMVDLEKEAAKPAERTEDGFAETFSAWKAENAWYDNDPDLQAAAFGIAEQLKNEGKTPEEQLSLVAKRIRTMFPAKFENPRRREAGAVEGASNARRASGKTYSDLPPEARKACDEFVRDIKGFTREQYLKDYDWS